MRVALYARVSKAIVQNPENQLIALRDWAIRADMIVVGEFIDEVSSKDTRPQKEAVLGLLRTRQADGVAFFSLDRWGRNMSELVMELEEFSHHGWLMMALKEQIDLSSAAGKMFAHILAAMANFERERIRERTLLGLARAKAQGKRLGRPRKTPPANPAVLSEDKTLV
jgi:DNA invertase Pin-like site-specific DNA recombinase